MPGTTGTCRRRWNGSKAPEGTAELVLICEDRDAERFLHWVVSGIDPGTMFVDEGGEVPGSTSWPKGFGDKGWGGPQPPIGDEAHRYFFRILALDRPLDLRPGASSDEVRQAAEDRHLAAGTLVGLFAR